MLDALIEKYRDREKPAAGLSPAATARLKDLYQGLNPRFYGTFAYAVRKLEGLEAGCTRGWPLRAVSACGRFTFPTP